jgi:hypothetical protein
MCETNKETTMIDAKRVRDMAKQIAAIRKAALELKELAGDSFPAVEKNADRILASVRMLELNVTDVVELT